MNYIIVNVVMIGSKKKKNSDRKTFVILSYNLIIIIWPQCRVNKFGDPPWILFVASCHLVSKQMAVIILSQFYLFIAFVKSTV